MSTEIRKIHNKKHVNVWIDWQVKYIELLYGNDKTTISQYDILQKPPIRKLPEILHVNMAITKRYQIRRSFLKLIFKKIPLPDLVMNMIQNYVGLETMEELFKFIV